MNCRILDGKKLANKILSNLSKTIKKYGIKTKLAVILIGNNPASEAYVNMKQKKCREIGINFELIRYKKDVSEKTIKAKIKDLNKNNQITGILIQLPLPKTFNTNEIINSIIPAKDVDGLTETNREKLAKGDESLACCTPKGILRLLEEYNINLKKKKIVLVGHGYLVGQPLSLMLKNRQLNFIICDKKTKSIKEKTKKADILISAAGVPYLIKEEYVKQGAVVIDAGTSKLNNKLVGDVDFDKVKEKAAYITPVPGGIGPMTIAMLLENILKAHKSQNETL